MPVSLQINLSPGDYLYSRLILPHQLKTLAGQVDEIILTIETKPSKGRFADSWNENQERLKDFLNLEIGRQYDVKIIPVDYSKNKKQEIASMFFGSRDIPEKDFRGGPFYAYFFGLYSASNNLVMHLDADIFLGGGSATWIEETCEFFKTHPECLFISPLPGPPHPEDRLIDQKITKKIAPYTFEFGSMSTRIFLTDRSRITKHKLSFKKPRLRNQIKALVEGNPNADLAEHLFNDLMDKKKLIRIDFLGSGKGLWSLHPPYHTKSLYDNLQTIIANIETGNLPETQLGFYDIVNEVCDWSEGEAVLQNNRWWTRLFSGQ
jgi:hypothetical protein